MATYGLDIYGKALYGTTAPLPFFSCDPMAADQSQYGALQISWATPYQTSGTVPPAWTRQRLVRNSWGVPDTEDDGWVCLDEAAGATSNTFLDNTVVPGRMYYYAVYVATGINTYSATQVYQPGDYTVFSSVNYICLATNTVGVTPGTNAAIWATTPVTTPWVRCGTGVVGLALADAGYRTMLYDLIPRPYKVATVETTASSIPVNDDLYAFVSMFGWALDIMKSENDTLLKMNNIEECTDRQLGLIAQQMGIDSRLPALPELRRSFVRDANAIQRQAGSAAALAELVTDLTGWQTTATVGYNQMLNLDSSTFNSSQAKAWNAATFYTSGFASLNLGDVVTYNGAVYFAVGGTSINALYLDGATAVTGGTLVQIPDAMAGREKGYVRLKGATVGSTLTVNAYVPAGVVGPSYHVYICLVLDPSGGQVTASVAGTPVAGWSGDLYAPSRRMGTPIRLGTYTSPPSTIPIVLTVTGKQAVSAGYDVFAVYALVQSATTSAPQNYNIAPVGAVNSSLYWTQTGLSTFRDADTERNWLTDGQGTWSMVWADGVVNPRTENGRAASTNGTFGIYPLGAGVLATGSPGPGNALAYTSNSGATVGKNTLYSIGAPNAVAWSASTAYNAGQPVLVGTTVYVARNYTLGDPPATSPTKWGITTLVNAVMSDSTLAKSQGIPVKQTPTWSAVTPYTRGDQVQWRDALYEAAQPVPAGGSPTGYATDNIWWRWLGPARRQYTFSAYHYRTATGTNQNVRCALDWYGEYGNFLGASTVFIPGQTNVFDHFDTLVNGPDFPPSTSGTPPTGWTTPAAYQQGTGVPWVTTTGTWGSAYGMAVPTGWNALGGTTTLLQRSAGRVLWLDRQWLYGGSTPLDTVIVTFIAAPFDPSFTMEQGITVRYASGTGYWLASRDRLSWTALTFSGSVLTAVTNTVMATWTPLVDGTRMKVNVTGTAITVSAMTGAQVGTWVQLATVTSNQFNTQTGYGLLERIHI